MVGPLSSMLIFKDQIYAKNEILIKSLEKLYVKYGMQVLHIRDATI